jgi:hypothetical protein
MMGWLSANTVLNATSGDPLSSGFFWSLRIESWHQCDQMLVKKSPTGQQTWPRCCPTQTLGNLAKKVVWASCEI